MLETAHGPAYRIETERLIIRCYHPSDAILLQSSIKESVEHLLPWMPWASAEPEEFQQKVERLRGMRAKFDTNQEFVFGIFNQEETKLIGGCGLHRRIGDKALEIGYWINTHFINQGYATEMAKALTKVAFEIEKVDRVEIHCDPKNLASAAIPKKLGYLNEAILKHRTMNYKDEYIDSMIWTIFPDMYYQSNLNSFPMGAYDVLNRKLL